MDSKKQAIKVFNDAAFKYQEAYMNVSVYSAALDYFCNTLKKKPLILDLACGPANVSLYISTKIKESKYIGLDLAPQMLELAKINLPQMEEHLMDVREFKLLHKSFDGIIASFCLPYLEKKEIQQLFNDAYESLNEDGILYISTMESIAFSADQVQMDLSEDLLKINYYPQAFVKEALLQSKFKIKYFERVNTTDARGNKNTDMLFVAQK